MTGYTSLTTPDHKQVINTTWAAANAVGLAPNLAEDSCDTTNGNSFVNTGREFVYIKNSAGASALLVTIANPTECTHGFDHDVISNVVAASGVMLGPFPTEWYGATVYIDYGPAKGNTPTISLFQLPTYSPGPS